MPLLGISFLVHLHPWPCWPLSHTLIFVFAGTYIIPAIISLILRSVGLIKSLQMKSAKPSPPFCDRICFLPVHVHLHMSFSTALKCSDFLMGAALSIGFLTVLLPHQKTSAHIAGIGGLIGLISFVSTSYFIDLFTYWIAAAAAGRSKRRLLLDAHTPRTFKGLLCSRYAYLLELALIRWFLYGPIDRYADPIDIGSGWRTKKGNDCTQFLAFQTDPQVFRPAWMLLSSG